ncbi:hypothetical protein V8G54_011127 [Vigna mungo]|uniref:Tf2-1-like SH3-like domain-containing protein n=1 Tax=Vigna mungo TaxID=3915 RepID=A0AAQ3S2M8_VIGMU
MLNAIVLVLGWRLGDKDYQQGQLGADRSLMRIRGGNLYSLKLEIICFCEIGPIAYEIALSPQMENLHNVFHVSQLRKYVLDLVHVLEVDDIQVREDLTFNVGPIRLLDVQTKTLRGKDIRTVKVLWNDATQKISWELEEFMKEYPYIFVE